MGTDRDGLLVQRVEGSQMMTGGVFLALKKLFQAKTMRKGNETLVLFCFFPSMKNKEISNFGADGSGQLHPWLNPHPPDPALT